MCLLTIALDAHADFSLVVMHNRDEFFGRPTHPLRRQHVGDAELLCANDAQSGGTWMGVNARDGRFAALTNVRCSPRQPAGASRGELVLRVLCGDDAALSSDAFSAFHLAHGRLDDPSAARLTTSGPPDWRPQTSALPGGVTAKSNDTSADMTSAQSDPHGVHTWPKVAWLRGRVEALLRGDAAAFRGEEGVRQLLGGLEQLMCAAAMEPPYAEAAASFTPDAYNPMPLVHERTLQRGPFVEPFELPIAGAPPAGSLYGTVSQSVLVHSASEACAFYCYRETATAVAARNRSSGAPLAVADGPHPTWTITKVPR
jgi:uncharacterized protein with NRDE domain